MVERGNGAHGQWGTWVMGTWVMGHMDIIIHRSRWWTGVMGHIGNGHMGDGA